MESCGYRPHVQVVAVAVRQFAAHAGGGKCPISALRRLGLPDPALAEAGAVCGHRAVLVDLRPEALGYGDRRERLDKSGLTAAAVVEAAESAGEHPAVAAILSAQAELASLRHA